ncbi:MAG: SGNH/GDSL hydrolase family protein [Sandaracinaceae bacterium]
MRVAAHATVLATVLATGLVCAALAVACDGPAPSDAGARVDAGVRSDGGDRDASGRDAGAAGDAGMTTPDGGPPPPSGPRIYPYGQRHSPLDESLADSLRARVAAAPSQRGDVFSKIGDSITVSNSFLRCFSGSNVDLDGRPLQPTIDHFRAGDAGGSDPFSRTSLCATVGWSASAALMGSPTPLQQELDAVEPRFASLMFGTNDVGFVNYDAFMRNMTEIVDTMLARGVLPVLSSIPPRDDNATANARVTAYGGLVRALAESRELVFIDYHAELLPLPSHGLAGDGVHPQSFGGGACVLSAAGLQFGANVRNLLVLEALDRMRRVTLESETAPDADGPRLAGEGTPESPFVVPALPFSGYVDTRAMGTSAVAEWSSCGASDESGPEVRFRVEVTSAGTLHAALASGAGADLDVHVVSMGGGANECIERDDREVRTPVTPGVYDVVVDSFAGMVGEGFLYVEVE